MLRLENCRDRQRRLLALMEVERLDAAVLTNPGTIYYFSGALRDPACPHVLVVTSSGKTRLITNDERSKEFFQAAVDDCEFYATPPTEKDVLLSKASIHASAGARRAIQDLSPAAARLGAEFESLSFAVAQAVGVDGLDLRNLTPALDQMRRAKDPDEIECIRGTVELVEAGLAALKVRLAPGMAEFKAYSICQEAMIAKAETSVALNCDFAGGVRAVCGGGPPSSERLQFGDLCIVDSWPSFHGYSCDIARTFVVGRPSQLQQDAWGHVMEAHAIAHRMIRPGARAERIYEVLQGHLDKFSSARNSPLRHAGRGVGLNARELPWLATGSEHVIEDREVLACEPALYGDSLQGGIRLEHNYLVTTEGVTILDHFPMDLV
jgi:Xaa-Pro aminopeptidase